MRVTLYSKPDCPLCDKLKADLLALQAEIGFAVYERDIEASPDDFARYRYLIPVVDIEEGEILYPPHDRLAMRQALMRAKRGAMRP